MREKNLPKILYISDVPVELSSAGATLLYRLLEHYPKDKLVIIQGVGVSETQQRIPEVEYHVYKPKIDRLRYTRFSKHTQSLFLATHLLGSRKINKIARVFKPDIILTVSIRLMWLNAFRLSQQLNKPLFVILHDDWLITENRGKWQQFLAGMFEKMYRHASERFCISPTMERYYHALYGVNGKVIYPARGKGDHIYPVLIKSNHNAVGLKYCYAGSLFTGDFAPMLDQVSYYIGKQHGELHVFSYWNKELLAKYPNLNDSHVTFHPFMHSADLMKKMNEEMDVAVLLNSFEHEESFKYNFSSKLVDYISAGLPVICWGPASSGSIAWAKSHGYDAAITANDTTEVAKLVEAFNDDNKRSHWANKIREIGIREFSYEQNHETFINAISDCHREE